LQTLPGIYINVYYFDLLFAFPDLELDRGEMTASALENHLNELEGKVEELLARFETHDQSTDNAESNAGDHSTDQEPQNDSTSAK
jgi:hypothetical protein